MWPLMISSMIFHQARLPWIQKLTNLDWVTFLALILLSQIQEFTNSTISLALHPELFIILLMIFGQAHLPWMHKFTTFLALFWFDNFSSSLPETIYNPTDDLSPSVLAIDAGTHWIRMDDFSSPHSDAGYQFDNFFSSHPIAVPLDAGFHLFSPSSFHRHLALLVSENLFIMVCWSFSTNVSLPWRNSMTLPTQSILTSPHKASCSIRKPNVNLLSHVNSTFL